MASARDIRRRIRSVKNIQQITKAMKMVAAARLRRAQERALSSRPYTAKIREVLASVAGGVGEISHPLLEVRPANRIAYLVMAGDKGLCGAYNSNVMKEAAAHVRTQNDPVIFAVGRKSRDFFKRRGYRIDQEMTGFSEKPAYEHARTIAQKLVDMYVEGLVDEIYLVYTQFISPVQSTPSTIRLLPVASEDVQGEGPQQEYIFEPSAEAVLDLLLPKYLETVIYGALLQASASELGSRMTAMGNATDNAQELIGKLTLSYNKVRQAGITRELAEIVGGAEALK
ncbi:MAG TPA: F0F1 ATP synthase subunit gamma [Firmicutes bacterium]|nr:F0F1 ATP synthase subunit gamma [Bacillota bacterium]